MAERHHIGVDLPRECVQSLTAEHAAVRARHQPLGLVVVLADRRHPRDDLVHALVAHLLVTQGLEPHVEALGQLPRALQRGRAVAVYALVDAACDHLDVAASAEDVDHHRQKDRRVLATRYRHQDTVGRAVLVPRVLGQNQLLPEPLGGALAYGGGQVLAAEVLAAVGLVDDRVRAAPTAPLDREPARHEPRSVEPGLNPLMAPAISVCGAYRRPRPQSVERNLLIPVSMIPVTLCQGRTKRMPATTSRNSPAEITLP